MQRAIYVIFTLLIFSMSAFAEDVEILTQNSYFEDDLEGWEVFLEGGAQMEAIIDDSDSVKGSQCVYLDIQQLGSDVGFWEVKLGQVILGTIEQGATYTLSLWAKGEETRQIRPHLRIGAGGKSPWISQHAQTHDITTEWAVYHHSFSAGGEKDGLLDIALGTMMGNLWLDNIRLYEGQYEEDPDLGRAGKIAVKNSDKLATTWGKLKDI